jgi:hypothetical protein
MSTRLDLRLILLGAALAALAVLVVGGINLFYPQFAAGLLDALSTLIPGFERTSTPWKVFKLAFGIGAYTALLLVGIRLLIRRIQR